MREIYAAPHRLTPGFIAVSSSGKDGEDEVIWPRAELADDRDASMYKHLEDNRETDGESVADFPLGIHAHPG